MLLGSISKHVKDQNWFAVGVDFFIVVVGILIAFQIANWSEQQQANKREQTVLIQLEEEFTEIKIAIEKQNIIRERYTEVIKSLIATLEGTGPMLDDSSIKEALQALRSTGRRPAQSAMYLQLMASGDLSTLTNQNLQKTLISYAVLLQRDAFAFPELMNMVVDEISSNSFIDYDISKMRNAGAAVDRKINDYDESSRIRSYDLEGLRQFEKRYEAMYLLHTTILNSDKKLLGLVNDILDLSAKNEHKQ